jgi:hypothetical protein
LRADVWSNAMLFAASISRGDVVAFFNELEY